MICETGPASWFFHGTIGKECTVGSWYSLKTTKNKNNILEQSVHITTPTGKKKQKIDDVIPEMVIFIHPDPIPATNEDLPSYNVFN